MKKANILIVEDERITAEIIQAALKKLGYAVSSIASTRKEAVKKAEELKPDLVLMDIMLNFAWTVACGADHLTPLFARHFFGRPQYRSAIDMALIT